MKGAVYKNFRSVWSKCKGGQKTLIYYMYSDLFMNESELLVDETSENVHNMTECSKTCELFRLQSDFRIRVKWCEKINP